MPVECRIAADDQGSYCCFILRAGRVVADGDLASLRGPASVEQTVVKVPPEQTALAMQALGGQALDEGRVAAPLAPPEAARRLVAAGVAILELGPGHRRLEDIFAGLTA